MSRTFTNYLIGIRGQACAIRKRFFRDKTALFFTFLFPLIFLFIFGSIFNNQNISFKISIINHSHSPFAEQFISSLKIRPDTFKIIDTPDLNSAQEKLKRSEINGIIELPTNFGELKDHKPTGQIKVLYAKGSEQTGNTLSAIFDQVANNINHALGHPKAPITVTPEPLGDNSLNNFDYTFTGLLAFSLINMGIFGLSNAIPTEKQKGTYRRLRASPLTKGQLLIATALVYILITILSLTTMLIAGLVLFKFNMRGSWLNFALFATLGAIMMNGIGLLIGGWAQNEKQSVPISNLVSMPMMFLSGTFFPTFLFPEWLQSVGQAIPITPIIDSIRLIMTENASFSSLLPQFTLISLWIFFIYFLAIKLFRWE